MKPALPQLRLDDALALSLLRGVTALAFIAGLLLAPKLWAGERLYPRVPLIDGLSLPAELEYVALVMLVILLALQLSPTGPRRLRLAPVVLCLIMLALDMSRLQPWVYQYMLMLGLCAWASGEDELRLSAALRGCGLIIAADYFWSGLQKLNAGFAQDVFPWFIEPLSCHLDPLACAVLHKGWWLAALGEASLGLLLLIPRTRVIGVIAALGMHLFILFCLGPFGHNWNSVVWPWNIAMAGFAVLLFWPRAGTQQASLRALLIPAARAWGHALALLLFGLLPALSFFNLWDEYLSCSLYSGNVSRGTLVFNMPMLRSLPEELQKRSYVSGRGEYSIDIYNWSFQELNVPSYPERRIFIGIAREFRRRYSGEHGELKLEVREKGSLISAPQELTLSGRLLE